VLTGGHQCFRHFLGVRLWHPLAHKGYSGFAENARGLAILVTVDYTSWGVGS
jgi:hypothetical protein